MTELNKEAPEIIKNTNDMGVTVPNDNILKNTPSETKPLIKKITNDMGTWIVKDGAKMLIEPSQKYLELRANDSIAQEKNSDLQKLREIDKKIIKRIPDMIERFLPLAESLGIQLTENETKLIETRKRLKDKIVLGK